MIRCVFHSVWNDGEYDIATDAMYDPETDTVRDIEPIEASDHLLSKLDVLDREYVEVNGAKLDVMENEDGVYAIVQRYYIGVVRYGYIEVDATSEEDAIAFVESLDDDEIEWDDDFHVDPENVLEV